MGAKNRSYTLPSIFFVDLSKVYRKFVKLIYAISTLLFLVTRKANRENKLKQAYLLFLLDRCTTSETFHDMQIAVTRATQLCDRQHVGTIG